MRTQASLGDDPKHSATPAHEALDMVDKISYSKILPHTPEAGDPYYIGDAYQESSEILSEWEADTCVQSSCGNFLQVVLYTTGTSPKTRLLVVYRLH